jgi:uncharacterized protein involved in exopolysaccharide biosynthesis
MSEHPSTDSEPRAAAHAGEGASPESRPAKGAFDEVNLLDLVIVPLKHKLLVFGIPFVAAIASVAYALLLPPVFTATARILPPGQSQTGTTTLLAQFAGLVGAAVGLKSPNELYVAMLKSRTVADNLIERFSLRKPTDRYMSKVRDGLAAATKITLGPKDGVISIEVDDVDPKRAAAIANAYVDELIRLTNVLAVTEASKRRLFFEQRFSQAKDNLAQAEAIARQALEKGGLVKVDDQGRTMVESTARLRAQITVKEVQIGAMRTFAADRNPDLRHVQQELESLKRELAKIEGTASGAEGEAASASKGIDNLHRLRDVKYYETIYELLAKQYEIAKIDEAKDSAVVQVLDRAIEPELKSKPPRRLIVIAAVVVSGFIAVLLAFLLEALERARRDPEQSAQLARLREHLRLRRRSPAA